MTSILKTGKVDVIDVDLGNHNGGASAALRFPVQRIPASQVSWYADRSPVVNGGTRAIANQSRDRGGAITHQPWVSGSS
jgi:hypothetical protein